MSCARCALTECVCSASVFPERATPGRGECDWIHTFTGRQFYPLSPRADEVDVHDIAHALSNVCRYTGHCRVFYSVAEHSVRVARVMYARTRDLGLARWGLVHDASEAYLADVARPVKHSEAFAAYRQAEARVMRAVCEHFDLPPEQPPEVSAVDAEMLGTEARALFQGPLLGRWSSLAESIEGQHGLGWDPTRAEETFLTAWRRLWPANQPAAFAPLPVQTVEWFARAGVFP